MMTTEMLFWAVFPYLALTIMVVASIYRFRTEPTGWTSKSSEFLEKRRLLWGSLLLHWGLVLVVGGHVGGLLVPISVYRRLGVPDELYHAVAVVMGGASGLAVLAGLVLLLQRRLGVKRIRRNTKVGDLIALGLLIFTAGLGMAMTLGWNLSAGSYEYRETFGPWVRGILTFHPDPALLAGAPWILKAHALSAFALFAVSPFTRLVHIWSIPLAYFRRPPIPYRRRTAAAALRQETAPGGYGWLEPGREGSR